jgi:hypothetical protein
LYFYINLCWSQKRRFTHFKNMYLLKKTVTVKSDPFLAGKSLMTETNLQKLSPSISGAASLNIEKRARSLIIERLECLSARA